MSPYPLIEPFDADLLRMPDGNEIYWEVSGNPQGIAAIYLHGGPGSGLGSGGYRRHFDPDRYMIVGIDQRGCGRSRPLAIDALADLAHNTTQTLIADIEAVRKRLSIKTWVVSGVSWGTTLALAYAQAHPGRVAYLVLVAVTTTSRGEIDWITEGVGCIFPEAWARFEKDSERKQGERVVEAYARRLAAGDQRTRLQAAESWNAWEAAHLSLDPHWTPLSRDVERDLNFATLVTHYWSNDGFLPGDCAVFQRIGQIAHIPAVLIHGRGDVSGPAVTPWRLYQSWPTSRVSIVEAEGHGGPESMKEMREALDAFASRFHDEKGPRSETDI
ncbi:prolyl aminopeptidase [Bradyrhizobium cenepequi]